jgi:hypothetical protein
MMHLIGVNCLVITLDITILALEYAGLYDIQTSYKALVYGAKLKLEFSILNRLVELTTARSGSGPYPRNNTELDTIDGERVKRTTMGRSGPGGNVGYKASVHAAGGTRRGDGKSADFDIEGGASGGSVMRTTEIVINREGMPSDSDGGRDLDSVETGVTLGSAIGRARGEGPRGQSPASSQETFARTWA